MCRAVDTPDAVECATQPRHPDDRALLLLASRGDAAAHACVHKHNLPEYQVRAACGYHNPTCTRKTSPPTTATTLTTAPSYHCLPGSPRYDPPVSISDAFFRVDGTFGCGDMMFSGHTCALVIDVCSVCFYPTFLGPPAKLIVVALAAVEATMIISARKHYTADVLVALYIATLLCFCGVKYFPDPPGDCAPRRHITNEEGLEAARTKPRSAATGHQYEQLSMAHRVEHTAAGAGLPSGTSQAGRGGKG